MLFKLTPCFVLCENVTRGPTKVFQASYIAIHAMRKMFEADNNDAVLLIDASNAFNSLNRSAALHNIRILCPTLATFAINTYREPAGLFITGGKEIKSAEGTTQGDPITIGLYAVSLHPLISHLNLFSSARQCWCGGTS